MSGMKYIDQYGAARILELSVLENSLHSNKSALVLPACPTSLLPFHPTSKHRGTCPSAKIVQISSRYPKTVPTPVNYPPTSCRLGWMSYYPADIPYRRSWVLPTFALQDRAGLRCPWRRAVRPDRFPFCAAVFVVLGCHGVDGDQCQFADGVRIPEGRPERSGCWDFSRFLQCKWRDGWNIFISNLKTVFTLPGIYTERTISL